MHNFMNNHNCSVQTQSVGRLNIKSKIIYNKLYVSSTRKLKSLL